LDDLVGTAALIAAADIVDGGSGDAEPGLLQEEWEEPHFDLAADAWLVFEEPPGSRAGAGEAGPVGYAYINPRDQHRQLQSWVVVHPDHRGRGIGWYLTDLVAARAEEHKAMAPPDSGVVLWDGTLAGDHGGHRLIEERGFRPVRHFWRMEAPLTDDLPQPGEVAGVVVRGFVLGQDDRGVHHAIQESFSEHWGFVARGFEEWAAHRLHEQSFDPDLWWVGDAEGEIVGALCGNVSDGVGWVGMLGVVSAWRKRGLGEALLRRSFLEFRRRGLDRVDLGVDAANETGATALYERVGMHVAHQIDVYEKRLR
jgi:mycothiol synthase